MTDARRDVSWSVVFRMEHSSDWNEWLRWPTSEEAVANAETLVKLTVVAEIRFERVIVQRDRFSLRDLAVLDDTEAAAELADLRAQARRIASHTYEGPGACRTDLFGETCGGGKTDHELIEEEA